MRRNNERRGLRLLCCFTVLTVLLLAGVAHAKGFMTPGFRTKETRPMHVVVLQPRAEFIKAKVVMTEDMFQESRALEEAGLVSVVSHLEGLGYEVKQISPEDVSESSELQQLLADVNTRYDEIWSKIVRKPKKTREGRYSVGDDAVRLSTLLEVHGIVIPRIIAVGHSAGKKVLVAMLWGAAAQDYGRLDFSVIEGTSGGVEGYFVNVTNTTIKKLTNKPDLIMDKCARKAFKKYPGADEVLEATEIVATAEAEEKDEEDGDIVSEFEALLGDEDTEDVAENTESDNEGP